MGARCARSATIRVVVRCAARQRNDLADDIRRRAVMAVDMLGPPVTARILILDLCRVAGNALLEGGALGGSQGGTVAREGLGKDAVELIGPAAVMLDDPIRNFGHVSGPLARILVPSYLHGRQPSTASRIVVSRQRVPVASWRRSRA